jgi:membrane protease subunit HflC
MTPNRIFAAIVIALLLFICSVSFFTVQEGSAALILRLGKIVSVSKTGEPKVLRPGFHVKIPFIDTVRMFDMRMQELAATDSKSLTVVTKEQTYLVVEYFAKWHISNLARFYTSTGGSTTWAETLLEQRLNDIVRAEYGKRTSDQVISAGRASLMEAIRQQADDVGKDQGINVVDVRIQQITLPRDVMGSVFKRMETERKQFAEAKRAEGIEKSEEIRALADQKVTVIKAQALMQGASIRAKGDLDAAQIYATAYNANPGFYAFYRSLLAYENSFAHKTDILVLKPEGQFFNYFHNAQNGGSSVGNKR